MDTAEELLTALIAKRFSYALRKALSSECVHTINELNRSHPNDACASHGFTDANRMMDVAFRAVMGRPPASHLHQDALCWHDAWQLARLSGFDHTDEIERLARLRPERETVWHVQALIDYRAARVSDPQTVYDYFVKEMRAAPGKYLSLDLPLTSRSGAFCAEAIDLASCLMGHVNSSNKSIDNYRDVDTIIAITRRIMNNYIIG